MFTRLGKFPFATCACFASVLSVACDSKPEPKPASHMPVPADRQSEDDRALAEYLKKEGKTSDTASPLPAGHPALTAPSDKPSVPVGATDPGSALALKFDVPKGWKPQPLSSSMRKAHYILPRAEGDTRDTDVILFYFGPNQGGSIEGNLVRWKGMFVTADGNPIPDSATKVDTFEADGLKVTLLDVTGRYVESNMMTGQISGPTPDDFRMLAAVIETSKGNWFFRGVGPAKTVAAQEGAFREMLKSARE